MARLSLSVEDLELSFGGSHSLSRSARWRIRGPSVSGPSRSGPGADASARARRPPLRHAHPHAVADGPGQILTIEGLLRRLPERRSNRIKVRKPP
jgi:hypothetical protein